MVYLGEPPADTTNCQIFNIFEDQFIQQLILFHNPNVGVTRIVPILNDGTQ